MRQPEAWPRQYARQITAMRTREERVAALAEVPEHLRALVRSLRSSRHTIHIEALGAQLLAPHRRLLGSDSHDIPSLALRLLAHRMRL